VQDGVDPAPRGAQDGDLSEPLPARMGDLEEELQHRGLVTVADRRAGIGVQLRAEVRAEREGQSLVGLDRGTLVPGLDPTKVGRIDAGRRREAGAGDPGVSAELEYVGGEGRVASGGRTCDAFVEFRRGGHGSSLPMAAYVRLRPVLWSLGHALGRRCRRGCRGWDRQSSPCGVSAV
jgi:hypothetical protein